MDAKVYYGVFDEEDEAAYLTAVLNSRTVNNAIKPFQSTGLQGARDIHTKPLELPIPQFDSSRARHRRLVELAKEATAAATGAVQEEEFPANLAGRRRFVRDRVVENLEAIDQEVIPLLGIRAE